MPFWAHHLQTCQYPEAQFKDQYHLWFLLTLHHLYSVTESSVLSSVSTLKSICLFLTHCCHPCQPPSSFLQTNVITCLRVHCVSFQFIPRGITRVIWQKCMPDHMTPWLKIFLWLPILLGLRLEIFNMTCKTSINGTFSYLIHFMPLSHHFLCSSHL